MGSLEARILVAVAFLLFVGLLFVYSASFPLAQRLYGDPFAFLIRQLLGAGLGLLSLLIFWRVDYHLWQRIDDLLLLGAFLASVLTLLPGVSQGQRWLQLGPLSFQPTEFGKLALVLYVASSLVRRGERIGSFKEGVFPYLAVFGAFGVVFALQPDFGMFVLYGALLTFLLYAGGVPWRLLFGTALAVLPVGGLMLLAAPYRLGRLLAFFNPVAYRETYGYQVYQSLMAIGAGGVWGRGLGASRAKLFYLPAAHNDFAFAVVAEETGFVGALILIGLLACLVVLGFRAAARAPDRLGALYALGSSFILGFQTLLNLGVVVGVVPVTGLTLPFVSYGGSSLAVTLALTGLLLGVARQTQPESGLSPIREVAG
ncbi:MAG: Cell division protein FtsW [Acetothermia bacterium 64_32]|nr:MAG: Cell division protein FtsW [Acetothermia bacterium 64_32]